MSFCRKQVLMCTTNLALLQKIAIRHRLWVNGVTKPNAHSMHLFSMLSMPWYGKITALYPSVTGKEQQVSDHRDACSTAHQYVQPQTQKL